MLLTKEPEIFITNAAFRCYEVKIEESEKAGSCQGVEPRTPDLSHHSATTARQPPTLTISSVYYMIQHMNNKQYVANV